MEWGTAAGYAKAFFATCLGCPLLSVTVRDVDGKQLSYKVYRPSVEELQKRGMVEETE